MAKKKAANAVVENVQTHIGENENINQENVVDTNDNTTTVTVDTLTALTETTTAVSAEELAVLAVLDLPAEDLLSGPEDQEEDLDIDGDDLEDDADDAGDEELSLIERIGLVTEEHVQQMLVNIGEAFDERSAYETAADPFNDNIQKNLKAYRAKMALPGIAGLMVATNVDPDFINRSISTGKRFNVYGIDKLNDLLHGINSGGHFKNAINKAIIASMFRFEKAGVPFTGTAALAAASDKVKVDKGMSGILVRHTVSASTAPTQSSSTMSALSVLGAVKNTGSVKHPVWVLTDAPVTQRLRELIAA